MFDTLDYSAFKTGYGGKQIKESAAFAMDIRPGQPLRDRVSGVEAICNIPGDRWGVVNGIVTRIPAYKPAVVDGGLRNYPAFTQVLRKSRTLTDAVWSKSASMIISGDNKITYGGTGSATDFVQQTRAISGGVASKIMTIVAKVSADVYPQTFRIKNTQVGVVDNFSGNITITKPSFVYYRVVNTSSAGNGTQVAGITPSTINEPFSIYAELNMAEANFIFPYSPNDTTENVSYVSETATATTGTSFDLDDAQLGKLKNAIRGTCIEPNRWKAPTLNTSWTADATYYICDGSVTYSPMVSAAVQAGKFYEIEFTTGTVTSGQLIVYIGGQLIIQTVPTANTTYRLRNTTATASANVAFSSGTGFIGQIRKDIVVKEVQAQGHLELNFVSTIDSGWLPSGVTTNINIFSANNSITGGSLYITKSSLGAIDIKVGDGTNNANVTQEQILNLQLFKIAIDWGTHSTGQKMQLTVNGVKSSLADFSGSLGLKDLLIGFGNTIDFGCITRVEVYDRPAW